MKYNLIKLGDLLFCVADSILLGFLQRIGELELQVKGLQGEMQKNCTEQEIITSRLAEKTKVNFHSAC